MKAFDYRNRTALRKMTEALDVSDLCFLDRLGAFATKAKIVDISSTGIMLHVERKDLDKKFNKKFQLEDIVGEQLSMEIDMMDLDIDGVVTRTKAISGDSFEVAIDYSAGAPEYWRECLVDLIPSQGEEEEEEEYFNPFVIDEEDY